MLIPNGFSPAVSPKSSPTWTIDGPRKYLRHSSETLLCSVVTAQSDACTYETDRVQTVAIGPCEKKNGIGKLIALQNRRVSLHWPQVRHVVEMLRICVDVEGLYVHTTQSQQVFPVPALCARRTGQNGQCTLHRRVTQTHWPLTRPAVSAQRRPPGLHRWAPTWRSGSAGTGQRTGRRWT